MTITCAWRDGGFRGSSADVIGPDRAISDTSLTMINQRHPLPIRVPGEIALHDSKNCPTCSESLAAGSMSDAAFEALLTMCRTEIAEKQDGFQRTIAGQSEWFYDLDHSSIHFGPLTFGITVIGSFSEEQQSWLWGWANETFPAHTREQSRQIAELEQITGFKIFSQPGFSASSTDAQDLMCLAVHVLGANAFFRAETEGTWIYFAVNAPKE